MTFTNLQIKHLEENRHVLRVTSKQVPFTFEFKKLALRAQAEGWSADEIFEEAGIPTSWFKAGYARTLFKNWRVRVREHGLYALDSNSGRPAKTKLPFHWDPEHLDELDKDELLQIIEHLNRQMGVKKISDPLPLDEWELEAHIKNSKPDED